MSRSILQKSSSGGFEVLARGGDVDMKKKREKATQMSRKRKEDKTMNATRGFSK
jgi:hypothetical protein